MTKLGQDQNINNSISIYTGRKAMELVAVFPFRCSFFFSLYGISLVTGGLAARGLNFSSKGPLKDGAASSTVPVLSCCLCWISKKSVTYFLTHPYLLSKSSFGLTMFFFLGQCHRITAWKGTAAQCLDLPFAVFPSGQKQMNVLCYSAPA